MSSAAPSSENDTESQRRSRILSSTLYFDVTSSKVHSEAYLNSLKKSADVAMIIEVPPVALFPNCLVQQKVLGPFRNQELFSGKACKGARMGNNVGGGFHHCCGGKGGGFCAYADISLCIHFAFVQLNISRVMIIDLDAHQGNGHETDFSNDSMSCLYPGYVQPWIYPFDYEARRFIDRRVEVPVAAHNFDPEWIVYSAGTDILNGDPLGRLKISPTGITNRDEKVFRFARERNVPIVMLTSGGYMKSSARVIADLIANLSNKSLIDSGRNTTST